MDLLHSTELGLLIYFTLSLLWSYALMFGAWRMLWNPEQLFIPEASCPLVSVLVPAYNEEACIVESVRQTLRNHYPALEVCICDDASTDSTSQLLIDAFDLEQENEDSRIWVSPDNRVKLFKAVKNRGRAGALNQALALAEGKYCVQTDADTLIDPHGLVKLVRMIMTPNAKIGAVGGTLLLVNEVKEHPMGLDWLPQISKKWIAGTQAVEYLRAFLYGRLGLNKLGGNVIVSGAFGLFKTDLVRYLGGWNEQSVAEDFDLTTRVRQSGGVVRFIPDPVAYTQAPADLRSLGHQRSRWHRGLTEIFFRGPGKECMFKHGLLGKWVLPVHFFVEWLAPIFEAIGLILVTYHIVQGEHLILLAPIMIAGYLLNVLLSLISIKFEKDNFNRYRGSYHRGVLYALAEPFWYRPLMIFWRLRGMFEYMTGKKGWGGIIKRQAFTTFAALLLMVSTAQGATRLEFVHANEVGEVVDRFDTSLSLTYDSIAARVTNREREDVTEREYEVTYSPRVADDLDLRIGTHISDRGQIFPQWGALIGVSKPLGNFVLNVDYKHQFFDSADLGLTFGRVDWYRGDWRFAVQGMLGTETDVHAASAYIQHIGEELNWTLYASQGTEVLDVPLLFGDNAVVGGILRAPITDNLSTLIGANLGSRSTRSYAGLTAGIRYDF